MNKYWRDIYAALDRANAKYLPVYRTYIVLDLLTAPEGSRIGDTIEYREPAIFGGGKEWTNQVID